MLANAREGTKLADRAPVHHDESDSADRGKSRPGCVPGLDIAYHCDRPRLAVEGLAVEGLTVEGLEPSNLVHGTARDPGLSDVDDPVCRPQG